MERIEPGSYFGASHAAGSQASRPQKKKSRGGGRSDRTDSDGDFSQLVKAAALPETEFAAGQAASRVVDAEAALDRIHALGDELRRNPSRENLTEYRSAVKEFLTTVVSGAYSAEQHESGSHVMNRKRYTLVARVNGALERLAVGLLQTQQLQLDVLERIAEIQGLLVDVLE